MVQSVEFMDEHLARGENPWFDCIYMGLYRQNNEKWDLELESYKRPLSELMLVREEIRTKICHFRLWSEPDRCYGIDKISNEDKQRMAEKLYKKFIEKK